MRSFPTRLTGSLARVALLPPCLLLCLACATPFPLDALEEGMTTETARGKFGVPEAIEAAPDGAESSWTYLHDELEPLPLTFGPMPLRVAVASIWGVPLSWFFAFTDLISDELSGHNWNEVYVSRSPVVLRFEEEELVSWEVLPDIRQTFRPQASGSMGYAFDESWPGENWKEHQQEMEEKEQYWKNQERIETFKQIRRQRRQMRNDWK